MCSKENLSLRKPYCHGGTHPSSFSFLIIHLLSLKIKCFFAKPGVCKLHFSLDQKNENFSLAQKSGKRPFHGSRSEFERAMGNGLPNTPPGEHRAMPLGGRGGRPGDSSPPIELIRNAVVHASAPARSHSTPVDSAVKRNSTRTASTPAPTPSRSASWHTARSGSMSLKEDAAWRLPLRAK